MPFALYSLYIWRASDLEKSPSCLTASSSLIVKFIFLCLRWDFFVFHKDKTKKSQKELAHLTINITWYGTDFRMEPVGYGQYQLNGMTSKSVGGNFRVFENYLVGGTLCCGIVCR